MEITGGRFRAAMLVGAAASLLLFASGAVAQDKDDNWPYKTPRKSPVLAVVGDVSCQPGLEVTPESGHEVCTDPANPNPNPSNISYTSTSLWQSQLGA